MSALSTPRTPGGEARLREEERKVVTRSRELLAADRLTTLAGRESKIAEESKRTSEALTWLDRRLEADLRAAAAPPGGGRLPFRSESRDNADVAKRAEIDLGVYASKTKVELIKSKADQLKEMMAERDKAIRGREEAVPERKEGESALSADAQRRIAHILGTGSEPSEHGGAAEDEEAQRRHMEEERVQTLGNFADGGRGSVRRVDPLPFSGLRSMSHAARTTAAPHIAHMYEQIYLDGDEEGADGEGGMAQTARTRRGDAGSDAPVGITMVLDEEWGNVQGGEGGVGPSSRARRSYFEEKLVQDLACCLRISPNRLRIVDIRPGPSWHRAAELMVGMLVVPPPAEEHHWELPSCWAVAEEMKRQAGDAASRMRSGGTGVRVLRGEIDKHRRLELSEMARTRAGPPVDPLKFSLLKGGLSGDVGGGHRALLASEHSKEAPQHALYMVDQVLPAAQRNEEGFWVDPSASKRTPELPRTLYGTWPEDQRTEAPRLRRQWRIMGAGAAIMLILVLWVLYLREDVPQRPGVFA